MKKGELASSENLMKMTSTSSTNKITIKASYEVSLLIVKAGKPYNIAEQVILTATKVEKNNVTRFKFFGGP